MIDKGIYRKFKDQARQGKKHFAVLVDPDDINQKSIEQIINLSHTSEIDYFLVGGSHIIKDRMDQCLTLLTENTGIPTIIFPGSHYQINEKADALLFLSLVSSRNAELLIGQQVTSAPYLSQSNLEIISTAYMLIDGGKPTTASYMSNSNPIPSDKPSIALSTAMASEMLGFKLIYMDAGSGASNHVSTEMVKMVCQHIEIPLIVGGGITNPDSAAELLHAGADMIVVGNAIEKDPFLLRDISQLVKDIEKII